MYNSFQNKEYNRTNIRRISFYNLLNSIFCVVIIVSNIISKKMVNLPYFQSLAIPAGLITYPLTFFISDFVTEVYGSRKAKEMVYHAFGMSILAYLIIKIISVLPSLDLENQLYFETSLELNGLIIMASLTAYIFSQTIDIQLYALIKKWTGENYLWLRNNVSTLIAQLIDTIIVNVIYLKLGIGMELTQIFAIILFSYMYKCILSVAFTPLFYFLVFIFKRYKRKPNPC